MAEAAFFQRPEILEYIGLPNVAEYLGDDILSKISEQCRQGFEEDEQSMQDWLLAVDEGMKLAKQIYEKKTDPWDGASSIKLPMISIATLQFASGAYSEIVRSGQVVKAHMPGFTPIAEAVNSANEQAAMQAGGADMYDRAQRVVKYMNWQLMEEMEEWEPEMDKLLHILPVVGCVHKKTMFNPILGRSETTLVDPHSFIVNQDAPSLDRAPMKSELLPTMSENDLVERIRAGLFLDIDYAEGDDSDSRKEYDFVECHTFYDIDGDGYAEPYVVTLERGSWKVARVVARYEARDVILVERTGEIARIEPVEHYSKYEFIPDFEGGYWSLGWAHLLAPTTAAANSLTNQLIDAGSLANIQGGFFGQNVKLQEGGEIRLKQGQWKRVKATGMKLADSFFPVPVREPSDVLFQLLGFITEMGRELASVTDTMVGEVQPNTPATTVLEMVEQGQKVFSSIHKRIYRAIRGELKKLYRLNYIYADPRQYQMLLNVGADPRMDFNEDDLDVLPTANPELSSKQQRRAQAQALLPLIYTPAGTPTPGIDAMAVMKFFIEQLGVENPEQFMPPPDPAAQEEAQEAKEADRILRDESVKQSMATTKKIEVDIQRGRAEVVKIGEETAIKRYEANVKGRTALINAEELAAKEEKTRSEADRNEADIELKRAQAKHYEADARLKEAEAEATKVEASEAYQKAVDIVSASESEE